MNVACYNDDGRIYAFGKNYYQLAQITDNRHYYFYSLSFSGQVLNLFWHGDLLPVTKIFVGELD